jgi:Domain of unknown function (DUF5069)
VDLKTALRSPRQTLGGYVILPRLIDKVRIDARGLLTDEYVKNLMSPSPLTLDRRFLACTGISRKDLKAAILSADLDEAVLAWVERHARPHSPEEKRDWAKRVESYRPDLERVTYRKQLYPDLAPRVDVGALNVFDLIDMDEGRIAIPTLSHTRGHSEHLGQ